jgi:membrane-bound ClpP family serine protease
LSMILDPWAITIIIIAAVVLLVLAIVYGTRAHRRRVTAGKEDLVGRTAEVRTVMNPKGTVFVEGENWTATSESGRIEPGEEAVITRVEGLKLWVSNQKKEEHR